MASRNRFRVFFLIASLASGAAYALACSDGGGSGSDGGADGDGGPSGRPDAAVGPTDAAAPATTMRLAHLAEDLGPVDFCYRMAKTSSFEGPVLGGGLGELKPGDAGAMDGGDASIGGDPLDASDGDEGGADDAGADGGAPRVGYRTVSRYLTLAASGPLTIALVAPGSTLVCDAALHCRRDARPGQAVDGRHRRDAPEPTAAPACSRSSRSSTTA